VDQHGLLLSLLGILERVKLRPAMYFGHEEPAAAVAFLAGFSSAAGTALGWDWERRLDVLRNVTTSRGWRWTAAGLQHQMVRKGWPASKIVTELIEIEADFIRRMTESMKFST
jgi:hypothetical protein